MISSMKARSKPNPYKPPVKRRSKEEDERLETKRYSAELLNQITDKKKRPWSHMLQI